MPSFYSTTFKRNIVFPETDPDLNDPPIGSLDVDITEKCTLRCTYCFKGKLALRREMLFETAQQMVRWLVKVSRSTEELHINFLGGEPMLAFDTLKKWMPFAVNYCKQRGKKLNVGITTNLTIFTEEHLKIFRFWHIGIHSSIDGIPKVQDSCRIFPNGKGSSKIVEENLPRIFKAWRTTHARSTIVPETVEYLSESFAYFLDIGFLKVAFTLAGSPKWNDKKYLEVLEEEVDKVLKIHVERMKRNNKFYSLVMVDDFFRKEKEKRQTAHCGAGRGLLHVDVEGFIWPCHRLNSSLGITDKLLLGHINGGFDSRRRKAFLNILPSCDIRANCSHCEAEVFCGCPCIAASWQDNGSFFDPGEGFCKAKRTEFRVIKNHLENLQKTDRVFYTQLKDWVFNYKW